MITAFRISIWVLILSIVSVEADASKLKLMSEEYPPYSYKREGKPQGLFCRSGPKDSGEAGR